MADFSERLAEIFFGLIPIAFGFALAYLIKPINDRFTRRSLRKRLAVILISEIEAIKGIADVMIDHLSDQIKERKENRQHDPKSLHIIEVLDIDFPTKIYDRILSDIGLFHTDLVEYLTNIYLNIELAHTWKRWSFRAISDIHDTITRRTPMKIKKPELELLRLRGETTVNSAELYLVYLKKITLFAEEALAELAKIKKPKSKEKT